MSRLPLDDDMHSPRRSDAAGAGDPTVASRSTVTSIDDDGGSARLRRQREDPRGRRSLTGLELRRQRSR